MKDAIKAPIPEPPAAQVSATASAPAASTPAYRFCVCTPVPNFRGARGGVWFCNGLGYTNDEDAAAFLAGLGFTVHDAKNA
jgi:hypothetical protein